MKINIAIDGPLGAGKSAIAKALAARLGYEYIDTGSLYRSIAYIADRAHTTEDIEALIQVLEEHEIDYRAGSAYVDGRAVGDEIRTERISSLTSTLSKEPEVRAYLLALQRRLANRGGTVMEGRDIGTVVLPDAELKFFLTATEEERARRRYLQRKESGESVSMEKIRADLHNRDLQDSARAVAPLVQAEDAILVDSTSLSPEEVVERMATYAEDADVL